MKKIKKLLFEYLFFTKKIIIFESNPDFSDNTYWVFRYFAENDLFKDYKFVWFISNSVNFTESLCGRKIICVDRFSKSKINILKRMYYLQSAKIIIDCNRTVFKVKENQIRIYLGHGMPIKKAQKFFENKARGDCDLLPILGENFREIYEGFGYGDEICNCGYPRNEILNKIYPEKQDDKYIIWMPTYRQNKVEIYYSGYENKFPLGIPVIKTFEELLALDDFLVANKIKLFIRLHPAQDLSYFQVADMKNIIIADDEFLSNNSIILYEFVAKSSALITDYSSIYYDYLLTNRPIGLTFEDAEEYAANWGLWYENIREELPGYKIDSISDMMKFINNVSADCDDLLLQRENFKNRMGIENFQSCRMITDFLINKLE